MRLEANLTPGWIERFACHNGLKRFNHIDFLRRCMAGIVFLDCDSLFVLLHMERAAADIKPRMANFVRDFASEK
ncbi:MAG: hypothetical protein ACK53Y_07655, partial [bacterium]